MNAALAQLEDAHNARRASLRRQHLARIEAPGSLLDRLAVARYWAQVARESCEYMNAREAIGSKP